MKAARIERRPADSYPVKVDGPFRVIVFGRPRAPWRDTRKEAMQDAIDLELASYDRSQHEWFLAVPVEIERENTLSSGRALAARVR